MIKDCKKYLIKIEEVKSYLIEFDENGEIKNKIYLFDNIIGDKNY